MMQSCTLEMDRGGRARLGGVLTFQTTTGMYREMERYLQNNDPPGRIDLAAVDSVDSAGLALLIEWQASRPNGEETLVIENAPDSLLSLARLCEAVDVLNLSGRNKGS